MKRASPGRTFSFFGAFELGQDLGDEDGFVVLARTPQNEHLFQPLVAPSKTKRRDKVAGRFESEWLAGLDRGGLGLVAAGPSCTNARDWRLPGMLP